MDRRSCRHGPPVPQFFPGAVYGGYGPMIAQRDYEPVGFSVELGLKDGCSTRALRSARSSRRPVVFGSFWKKSSMDVLAHGQGAMGWASVAEVTRCRVVADAGHSVGRPASPALTE